MTTPGQHRGMNGDLIDAYLATLTLEHAPRTTATYSSALRRAHAELPVGLPTACPAELQAWVWRDGRAWSTRAVYLAAARGFFRWALAEHHLDYDPTTHLPKVRRHRRTPRPATDEQARIVLTRAREPERTWAVIAAYAGARSAEIASLHREDITRTSLRILGKGGHERTVPTHPALWAAVHDLPPGLVAEGRSANRVSQRISKECDRLDVPDLTAHRLRHWYATVIYSKTRDLLALQRLLGHISPATTAGYTAVADATLRRAVLSLPAWADAADGAAPAE
jgi:integrase/recombinase XerC